MRQANQRWCSVIRAIMFCWFLVGTGVEAGALTAGELPSGIERPGDPALLRGLVNKPAITYASVIPIQRKAQAWCATKAECVGVFRLTLESLARLLRDHENYPAIFPRISGNIVRREGGRNLEIQTVSFAFMGINYSNTYTLEFTDILLDKPRRMYNRWVQVESEDQIAGVQGLWYLEEFALDGAIHTFARYRMQSEVPQSVPGQATLMQLFIGRDLVESMRNVARLAEKAKTISATME